jgi:hypothetical protein
MKRQPNMRHKLKEEVFIYALPPARASLMPVKSMTPTTTTAAVVVAAATEGRRAYRIIWRGEMKK